MTDRTYGPLPIARLAAQFRKRRRALRMTQAEVAELADVSQRFVSLLENGKVTARLDKVADVADALGLALTLVPHDAASRSSDVHDVPDER